MRETSAIVESICRRGMEVNDPKFLVSPNDLESIRKKLKG